MMLVSRRGGSVLVGMLVTACGCAVVMAASGSAWSQTAPEAAASEASQTPTGVTGLAAVPRSELIGADIATASENESVGTVQDVLLGPDGQAKSVAARLGGLLGVGDTTVLLAPDEVEVDRTAEGKVQLTTPLTPDDLKNRPPYAGNTAPAN